jgi:hypothetical protein
VLLRSAPSPLQRYQNVKSELESQQNIERIRAEKFMAYHVAGARGPAASPPAASRQASAATLGRE